MCTKADTELTTTSITAERVSIRIDQLEMKFPIWMNGARVKVS